MAREGKSAKPSRRRDGDWRTDWRDNKQQKKNRKKNRGKYGKQGMLGKIIY